MKSLDELDGDYLVLSKRVNAISDGVIRDGMFSLWKEHYLSHRRLYDFFGFSNNVADSYSFDFANRALRKVLSSYEYHTKR